MTKALQPSGPVANLSSRFVSPKARLTPTPADARPAEWYRPPAPRVRPPIRVRAAQEAARLRKRGLYVGRDRETGLHQYMDPAFLATHMVVLGRTGVGKTMFLAWLFRLLAQQHDHTIIVLDPKGDLYDLTKRVAIADGLTKRVVCFDPADPDCAGFNPLKPNGLPEFTHAKAVREAIRSAWGQADFFQTPQLARFLFLALAVARLMEFDLVQALQVLVPGEQGSTLRKSVLPKLADPFIQASLQYLDGLPERRQEELVAPCLARLEAFCLDPMIRSLLTGRTRVLDIAEVIERRQICLVNLSKYQPLRKDDVGLLGKLLVNDILVKVFERPKEKRTPVIFIADEIQNFATFDFCDILDEGRGLMLWCILAHQHLAQLMDEEKSGYLHHSIMADARTKILFNALPEDVEALSKQVFLDGRWHPFMMKDELDALEQQFLEERRISVSAGKSGSQGRGVSWTEGGSIADSVAHTQGSSRTVTEGTSEAWTDGVTHSVALSLTETEGSSRTHGVTDTDTQGTAHTELTSDTTMSMRGHAEGFMQGHNAGVSEGEDRGISRSYDYMAIIPNTIDRSSGQSSGSSASDSEAESTMDSQVSSTGTTLTSGDTDSFSHAHSVSDSESQSHARSRGITQGLARTDSYTYGVNASVAETASKSVTTGRTHTSSQSVTESRSEEEGWNAGQTLAPFLAPYARRVPTSRTYLTWEEHTLICTALASGQDKGQCMLKLPLKPLLFLDAPWWEAPFVTRRMLARANERIRDNIPVEVLPLAADADHSAVIDVTPVPVPAIPMEASPVNVAPETYDRSRFRRPRTPSA